MGKEKVENDLRVSGVEETDPVEQVRRESFYIGKDKITIWRKHHLESRFSKYALNVVRIFHPKLFISFF